MTTIIPDLAELAQKECLSLGATEVEAYAETAKSIEVYIERNEIQSERTKINHGLGIRCLVEKQLGFAYTTILTRPEIHATAKLAYKIARNATPNPDWVSLPAFSKATPVDGIYDKETAHLAASDAVILAKDGLEAALSHDRRVKIDSGKLGSGVSSVYLTNSHGVEGSEESTGIYYYLVAIASEKESPGSFASEYQVSTSLPIDVRAVGTEAARRAISSLGAKTPKEFTGTLILTPDSAGEIFGSVLEAGVNGEEVYRKRSPLAGKIGEEVASASLSIVDDGRMPKGISSSSFDDEGIPRGRTTILEKGVLRNYLYDSYAANREGKNSTGNAARSGGGPRYSSLPRTSQSNFLFNERSHTLEEMIAEVGEGILLGRFSGNITETSGDFSGTVKQGFYIKNGEIQSPVTRTMVAGNVYSLLPKISDLGRPRQPTFDGTYIPPIRVEEVSISTENG